MIFPPRIIFSRWTTDTAARNTKRYQENSEQNHREFAKIKNYKLKYILMAANLGPEGHQDTLKVLPTSLQSILSL